MLGRVVERGRIDELLVRARGGECGVLVLVGEAGVGKSTLLRYAVGAASGFVVVSASGVEAEVELEYSGLLELVRPLSRVFGGLSEHQVGALQEALGLAPPRERDRFSVGVALLSLLAAAAEEGPVLVAVKRPGNGDCSDP